MLKKKLLYISLCIVLLFVAFAFNKSEKLIIIHQKIIDFWHGNHLTYYNYINRGDSEHELGNHKMAIFNYTKAIGINSKAEADHAYFKRGNEKVLMKDYIGAIADYTIAIEINPILEEAYYKRGTSKWILADRKGAIDDFSMAFKINPLFDSTSIQAHIQNYLEETETNQLSSDAYYDRGIRKILAGHKNSGCLDLSKAGELQHEKAYDMICMYCQIKEEF